MSEVQPIYDLTYRNYDGPLVPPSRRWWVIARTGVLQAFRLKGYWISLVLGAWYYLAMLIVLFFIQQFTASANGARGLEEYVSRIVWKDQFVHGLATGQLFYFVIVLMVGVGAIANDNRANALLVYLSKPCTKADYLIGKWMGIFIPLFFAMALPALVFFLYCALSYREYGFLEERSMLPLVMLAAAMGAAFHTSIVLGVSSLFRQGRLAGAAHAGLYFIGNFFTVMMAAAWVFASQGQGDKDTARLAQLFYVSIDGVQIAFAKALLKTDGSPVFGVVSPEQPVPAPAIGPFLWGALAISMIAIFVAWRRVRAVEVVA